MSDEMMIGVRSEFRVSDDGKKLGGYVAKFDSPSDPIGGYFREIIRPGAFRDSLAKGADVRLLVNHDPKSLLARTKSGTMRMREDTLGLLFEADLPDTTLAKDTIEQVRRGDLSGMSFGFRTVRDAWGEDEKGQTIRQLLQVEIFDASLATYPAYPDTEVGLRTKAFETWKATRPTPRRTAAERRLRLVVANG